MQYADTLTVVHHDDTRTRYTDVRYVLDRHGIRIFSDAGEHAFTDVLTTHAYRQRRTPPPHLPLRRPTMITRLEHKCRFGAPRTTLPFHWSAPVER